MHVLLPRDRMLVVTRPALSSRLGCGLSPQPPPLREPMYTYTTRTVNPREQGMSLDDCCNALARQGWRIVAVLAHEPAGATRLLVERVREQQSA